MFQQRHIEEYQNITAPIELKDRARFSVNVARRKMKQKMAAVSALAAGIALFCVSSNLLGNSSTILSVNDVVVTREAHLIEHRDEVLLAANMGQSRSLPIYIPMEIEVEENTEIEVNVGTLIQVIDENQYSEETTHTEISERATVYWLLDGAFDDIPVYTASHIEDGEYPICTVISGEKVYQYVVEYQVDTKCYSIRKTN